MGQRATVPLEYKNTRRGGRDTYRVVSDGQEERTRCNEACRPRSHYNASFSSQYRLSCTVDYVDLVPEDPKAV